MSCYTELYLVRNNEVTELLSVGASCVFSRIFNEINNIYESAEELTQDDLNEAENILKGYIKCSEDHKKAYDKDIDLICKMNNSVDEKLEAIDNLVRYRNEESENDEYEYWLHVIQFLKWVLENTDPKSQYTYTPARLFLGVESSIQDVQKAAGIPVTEEDND